MRRGLIGIFASGVLHAGIVAMAIRGHPPAPRLPGATSISFAVADSTGWPLQSPKKEHALDRELNHRARSPRRPPRLAAVERAVSSTHATEPPDNLEDPVRDGGVEGGAQPAPFVAIVRLDRIRNLPDAQDYLRIVDQALSAASWRSCVRDLTGLDLYRDADVLVMTSPTPPGAPGAGALLLAAVNSETKRLDPRDAGARATEHDEVPVSCGPVRVSRPASRVVVLLAASEPGRPGADGGPDADVPGHWGDEVVASLDPEALPADEVIAARAVNAGWARPAQVGQVPLWPPPSALPRTLSLAIRAAPGATVELTADYGEGRPPTALDADWPVSHGNPFILLRTQGQAAPAVGGELTPVIVRASASPPVVYRSLEMLIAFAAALGRPEPASH